MDADGLTDDQWTLGQLLHEARQASAWGGKSETWPSFVHRWPARKNYTHNRIAEIDLALDQALAVLNAGWRR
jgi:hypothetical protein